MFLSLQRHSENRNDKEEIQNPRGTLHPEREYARTAKEHRPYDSLFRPASSRKQYGSEFCASRYEGMGLRQDFPRHFRRWLDQRADYPDWICGGRRLGC